jgi:hypothetical protein
MARLCVSVQAVADALQAADDQATKLVSRLTPNQAEWQPNAQSWSIRQCFDHLAQTNMIFAESLQEAVSRAKKSGGSTSQITPGWFGVFFVAKMEPPATTKFKNPPKVNPSASGNIQDALAAFKKSHEPVRKVLESATNVDLNRVRFRSPFLSILYFTVGTGLLTINAHDRRHIWQAERIAALPEFPPS